MKNTALTRDQILGNAPISREQLIAGIQAADEDFKAGRTVKMPRTYAGFRKVLGLANEKVSYRAFPGSIKRLRRDTR